jgi:hemolysin D
MPICIVCKRVPMTAARNIISFPRPRDRARSYETAFLPAALEVTDTPPSPIGRTIAYAIITLFCVAITWAYLGRVDIVASAKGKVIPSGHTKVIQAFETGVVRVIHVHDGQTVKAGERLIELDPTMNDAESKHYQSDLVAAQLDVARLEAELADGDALANFKPPAEATPDQVAVQRQFLLDQTAEQQDKLAVLSRQRQQKQAEHETIEATINKLEASLPILQERMEIRKTLFQHSTGSKASYLELLQPLVEEQHELEVQKRHSQETAAAIAAIDEQRMQAVAEFRRTRYGELVEGERKAKGLNEDLIRAQHRASLQVLTAPVDGTVQQLAVHTIGGVVTPAQALLVLVPSDSHLEIEAMVSNRDIGFVEPGQKAEIKVDTFNFTRYGLLHGRVLSISRDAIVHERRDDKARDPRLEAEETSEPHGEDLVYTSRITLDRAEIDINGKPVALSPGMAVTVEIRTGSRRIISYLLSPLARYRHEALRER